MRAFGPFKARSFNLPRMPRPLPVVLAVASGLVTSGLIYGVLSAPPKATAAMLVPMVVVADAGVSDSNTLSAGELRVIQVPARPQGAFASVAELQGRLPMMPIPQGEPILESALAPPGTQPGLWHSVHKGMRAITVAINEVVGVGGFLKPGLHVDIIGVDEDQTTWASHTVAQDVPILAIAQDDQHKKDNDKAQLATSATLLVTPKQAEGISLASERGRIRLALRAQDDHALTKESPPKPSHAQQAAAPAPKIIERRVIVQVPQSRPEIAPRPAPPIAPGIEIIRGDNIEVIHP